MIGWIQAWLKERRHRAAVDARLRVVGLRSWWQDGYPYCLFCGRVLRELTSVGFRTDPHGRVHKYTKALGYVCLSCEVVTTQSRAADSYKTIEAAAAETAP